SGSHSLKLRLVLRTWAGQTQLRDRVSSGKLRQQLTALYADLSAVLHARRSVEREEARRLFENTLKTIEQLYGPHDL
ncbi:MAG: hypothetical protein WD775_13570, partial [Burkholderiales bacterium]